MPTPDFQVHSSSHSSLRQHLPVMVDEVVACFAGVPDGVIVDATFGLGGHALAILNAFPNLQVLGLDQDESAVAWAENLIRQDSRLQNRLIMRRVRFDFLDQVLEELSISRISGALFDLGVSSPQLDIAERGFSYRQDGPLDMRMDRRNQLNAAEVVNNYQESELSQLISENADEKFARRIARAIVAARPITSTVQLAQVVVAAIPAAARRTGGHPAKRTFQAIRIEVNKELEILESALQSAIKATKAGGRVAVLTYHSGENRIVKRVLAESGKDASVSTFASPYVHESQSWQYLTRRVRAPKHPTSKEQALNPRAKSARLRVIEKTLAEVGN